jgi:hypothetical protein
MSAKLKYHNINWENGMKITRDNFIQQDNVTHERVQDVFASFLNSHNYGLLPYNQETATSVKTTISIDNQNFLKVKIFQCRAVTEDGGRIEIFEEHLFPEFKVNMTRELEAAEKGDGGVYFVILSVDVYNRQPFGNLDAKEEPPRYPYAVPMYKVNVISEKQLAKDGIHPFSFFIGKLELSQNKPEISEDYIPPCMTLNSHVSLLAFHALVGKFYGELEINVLSIISKIREKEQDTSLAQTVLKLAENLLYNISSGHLSLRWELPNLPPVYLFEHIATTARIIRNTIDSNTSAAKEELLNYFTNWSELKQGDFEKLLLYCINFDYHHYDILISVEQFGEFIQIIGLLFEKLESLAYIGKKKETNIFVKEQKTKRSFLAD